jgi:hypothetical protein
LSRPKLQIFQDTAAAVDIDPYGNQDIVKIPRLEEGTASSQPPLMPSILRDAAQNGIPAQASTVSQTQFELKSLLEDLRHQLVVPACISSISAKPGAFGDEDGYSSDVEIPTIDIEPDTEDEDEIDED